MSFGLGGVTAAFAGALLLPRAAQSAVPSIEEYYGAPGAKKKTDTFLNRSPQPKQPQTGTCLHTLPNSIQRYIRWRELFDMDTDAT